MLSTLLTNFTTTAQISFNEASILVKKDIVYFLSDVFPTSLASILKYHKELWAISVKFFFFAVELEEKAAMCLYSMRKFKEVELTVAATFASRLEFLNIWVLSRSGCYQLDSLHNEWQPATSPGFHSEWVNGVLSGQYSLMVFVNFVYENNHLYLEFDK